MDGQYLNMYEKYVNYVTQWVNYSIRSEAWLNNADLHIDEIDNTLKSNTMWIDASIYLFDKIMEIIDHNLYRIILAIPLSYSDSKTDLRSLTYDYLRTNLNMTPPSFYLMPKDSISYKGTLKGLRCVEILGIQLDHEVYFREELEDEEVFYRCIYITSQGIKK